MTETVSQTHPLVTLSLITTPLSEQEINLALGIQFSSADFSLAQGNVKFGLTGSTLQLQLQEARFTEFSEQINHQLPIEKSPTVDAPSWKIALPAGIDILKTNALENIELGKIAISSENWSIEATLTVEKSDLQITEIEGLWRHDIHPNQQAILHRKIALFLRETQLSSPLISLKVNSPSTSENTPQPSEKQISSLLKTIEQIKTFNNDHFLELCEIAALNPKLDFAGANLRGTTLRGLDLNGANWSRVNLRGADLTDIDLSEANLQGAKLSGADLSGAYLSNANFKNTDFHRSSLALANLSGANLQGANLQEANLSQTNLNHCQLEGAKFDYSA